MTIQLKKKIKSKNFIMYLVFGLAFVSAILLSQLSNSIHVKIFSPLLVVVCFIFFRVLIQLQESPKKPSDELRENNKKKIFQDISLVLFFFVVAIYFFEPSSRSISSYFMLLFIGWHLASRVYVRQNQTLKSVDELEKQILLEIYSWSYNSILTILILVGTLGFIIYHYSVIFFVLVTIYFFSAIIEKVVEIVIRKKYE